MGTYCCSVCGHIPRATDLYPVCPVCGNPVARTWMPREHGRGRDVTWDVIIALALAFFGAAALLPAASAPAFVLMSLAAINLAMGVFNLLPIPGLDGFRLAVWAMPESLSRRGWTSAAPT